MALQQMILFSASFIVCAAIVVWYVVMRNRLKADHSKSVGFLNSHIKIHQKQIAFREASLNHYDFLKYNLNEALVIQKQINVTSI